MEATTENIRILKDIYAEMNETLNNNEITTDQDDAYQILL